MGPFFALGDLSACPTGSSGGCGSARCWRSARGGWCGCSTRSPGARAAPATWPAALLYMLNPYVVTYVGRTSITLLATAALPWLLLCVHRGLRDPRGWWWPAAFALVLTSTGGGVNVAVTAWLLLGPALLVVYELGWGARRRRARCAAVRWCGSCRSRRSPRLWWVAAVLVHARYGLDFLPYTEQPGTIWSTTSLPESLRLLGFWTSYIGVGYTGTLRAFQADARRLPRLAPVVVATLAVPRSVPRRRSRGRGAARYAPVLPRRSCSSACWSCSSASPRGRRCAARATFTYNHVQAVQLPAHDATRRGRSSRSASPASAALARAARCARACGPPALVGCARRWSRARVLAAGARASALDRQLGLPHGVPAAWTRRRARPRPHAAARRARDGPARPALRLLRLGRHATTRSCPALTDRPGGDALHRPVRRPARGRPAVDDRRAGQPAARRCPASCRRCSTSWASAPSSRAPTTTARAAAPVPGLARRPRSCGALGPPAPRATGRRARSPGAAGTLEPRRAAAAGPPLERADRRHGARAAARRRDGGRRLGAGDRRPRRLRRAARPTARCATPPTSTRRRCARRPRAAASFVISDSNRRRVFVAARLRGNAGWTRARRTRSSPRTPRCSTRSRGAGPTRRPSRSCGGGVASVRADFSPRLRPVPRAPPVRGARRRPVDRVARRPRAGHRSPPPRRRASRRRATSTTSTSCPTATARVASTASRSTGASSPCATGGTALPVGLRGVRVAERADRARRPAADRRGRRGRHPRAAHPRRAGDRGAAPAGARRARAARRRPAARAADLPLRPHHRRRPAAPARRHRRALARAWCATSRTASAAGRARSRRPRRARGAPTRGSAWRPRRPTTCSTRWAGERRRDGLRRLLALRGPRAQPRLVGLRRRPAARVDRRLDPLARRVASVAHAGAADDPHAAPRARPGARALPDPRARGRRRPADGAAGRGGRRHRRPARRRCARARCASRSSTPPSRAGTPGLDRSAARSAWGR